MKKIFLILFIFAQKPSFAQELILCQKIKEKFDFFEIDYYGFATQKTIDGNLVVVASINKNYGKLREKTPILIKMDTIGNILFKKGLTLNLNVKAFVNTPDSGFLIVGSRYRVNTKYRDAGKNLRNGLIARFDKNANLLWEKEVDGFQNCEFKAIEVTKDGNFILIAEVFPLKKRRVWNWDYNTDIGIYKIDANGEIISQDFYGGDSWDKFKKLQKLSDDSFELLLSLNTNEKRLDLKPWLMKFNPNGVFQSQSVGELGERKDISSFHTLSEEYKIGIGTITNKDFSFQKDSCRFQGIIQLKKQTNKVEKSYCDEQYRAIAYHRGSIYIGGYKTKFKEQQYSSVSHTGLIKKFDDNGNLLWDQKIIDPDIRNIKVKEIINISSNTFWVITVASNYLTDGSLYIYKLKDISLTRR